MMMDRPAGEQGAERQSLRSNITIRKYQDAVAVFDGLFGFLANAVNSIEHASVTVGLGKRDVNRA